MPNAHALTVMSTSTPSLMKGSAMTMNTTDVSEFVSKTDMSEHTDMAVMPKVYNLLTAESSTDEAIMPKRAISQTVVSESTIKAVMPEVEYSTTAMSNIIAMTNRLCVGFSAQLLSGDTDLVKLLNECLSADALASSIESIHLTSREFQVIIDSGASAHMLPSVKPFYDLTNSDGRVKLGNSTLIPIKGIGDTALLNNVYHVPDLHCGLISIGKLDSNGYTVAIHKGKLIAYDKSGVIQLSATLINNLYHLDDEFYDKLLRTSPTTEEQSANHANIDHASPLLPDCVLTNEELDRLPLLACTCQHALYDDMEGASELQLLHNRLGHLNESSIKSAVRNGRLTINSVTYDKIRSQKLGHCEACYRGKMRAFNNSGVTQTIYDVLSKICTDYKGPFKTACIHKDNGYIILTDQASHFIKIYPVSSRSQALDCFKHFMEHIVLATNHVWTILQADCDTAFLSKSVLHWLTRNKIRQHLSAPYKHSQNGMVERAIQTIMNDARTAMAAYDVPHKYWCYAVSYAEYNHNRLRVYEQDISPYERVFGVKPDMTNAIPFFAPGVYHLPKETRRDKAWSYRAEPCRMLGYSDTSKNTYIVLRVPGGKVVERHDCRFNQNVHDTFRANRLNPATPTLWEYVDQYYLDNSDDDIEEPVQEGDDTDKESCTDSSSPLSDDINAKDDTNAEDDASADGTSVQNDARNRSHRRSHRRSNRHRTRKDKRRHHYRNAEQRPSDKIQASEPRRSTRSSLEPRRSARLKQGAKYAEVKEYLPYTPQSVCCIAIGGDERPVNDVWDVLAECFIAVHDNQYYIEKWADTLEAEALMMQANVKPGTGINNIQPLPAEPKSVGEALNGPDRIKWLMAIFDELSQMDEYNVFGPAEQSGRGMKMKIVLKVKYDNDFSIRYKARLVGCGYSQIYGVDFKDTYAPTSSVLVINLVLHLMGINKYHYEAFDVKAAFLEAENDFDNYAYLPGSLFGGTNVRVKLLKSLYGERQAARLWSEKLNKILLEIGFESCPDMPTLYRLVDGDGEIIVITHVDDGLVVSDSLERIKWLHGQLNDKLREVKRTAPVLKFLGCLHSYDRDAGKLKLSQEHYINDLDINGKPSDLPMAPNLKLRTQSPNPKNPSLLPETGKLRYLADRTRWDIATAVGEVSSGGAKDPSDKHVETCDKIKRYLLGTADYGLFLGGNGPLFMFAFSDAQYMTDSTCKSRLGGCIFLGLDSGAFYSFSTNSTLVAQSSTHSEIMAIFKTVRYIIHTRNLLKFLGRECTEPTTIYVDNKSAIEICNELKNPAKTGSINMQIQTIREHLNNKEIKLVFIPTRLNVADVLTKSLPRERHDYHTHKLLCGFDGLEVRTVEGEEAMIVICSLADLEIIHDN